MRYLTVLLLAAACAAQTPADSIHKILDDQVAAWNRGDIDTFMIGYNNSPETTFVGSRVDRGWEDVRRRYHERYPTVEKMGKLDFQDIEIQLLGSDYANVIGTFHLARAASAGGDARGVFTLLFRKTAGGWRIIQDHTS